VLRPQRSQDGDRCHGEARCGDEPDGAGHLHEDSTRRTQLHCARTPREL
jgi:hypothetical protein